MKQFFQRRRLWMPAALSLLALILLLTFAGCQTLRFRRLTARLFREELSADTLSMHYILANPRRYGISDTLAALPVYSSKAQTEHLRQLSAYQKAASSIHPLFFSKDSRLLLRLLSQHLSEQQQEAQFPYYAEPLSPSSGIQSSLPILLAEYTFRSRQDVENYLALLAQIPDFLNGIIAYEQEKSAAGLFMGDPAAEQVIDQCFSILDPALLISRSHFLNTTFSQRLQELQKASVITPSEAAVYEQRNQTLLLETVQPAYEALGDAVLLLKGTGRHDMGLSHFPDGSAYYALLLKQSTGSDRSVSQIKQLLLQRLRQEQNALSQLLQAAPALAALSPKDAFPAKADPNACLQDLCRRMSEEFPPLPASDPPPSHTVKALSESLAPYCSPAFYLTPPIDDMSRNTIYLNEKDTLSSLDLYTTLAHEGYPGHLYQTVYHQLSQREKKSDPARSLLQFSGYAEGWALYVEMHSYEYAKELLSSQGASDAALQLVDLLRLNRSIQLCLYTLLDLSIHYEGADYDSVQKQLCRFGITEPALTRSIYDYIVGAPANYPKYYVGYLEFELLKQAAQKSWGKAYSTLRFHQMVLDIGPCPFSVLWEEVGRRFNA